MAYPVLAIQGSECSCSTGRTKFRAAADMSLTWDLRKGQNVKTLGAVRDARGRPIGGEARVLFEQ
jgi:hypothetical protein